MSEYDTHGQGSHLPETACRPRDYEAIDASSYSRDRYGAGKGKQPGFSETTSTAQPAYSATNPFQPDVILEYDQYDLAPGSTGPLPALVDDSLPSSKQVYPEVARARRKRRSVKRVIVVIACILGIMLVGGSAYALWFTNQLDKALAPDQQSADALASVLAPERNGEPYYVLALGSDSREGNTTNSYDQQGDNERSDVMMLVRIDEKNRALTMLSIPRDTPYRCEDGSYVKINELFNDSGIAATVKAVSELTGLPISHHAEVRVSGLANIVDLLGGVTVEVPVDLEYETMDHTAVTIEAGTQRLNGKEAEVFARARHEFGDDQDAHRQDNVRQLLQAIIRETLNRPLTEIPGLVLQIAEYIDTDFRTMDAISLASAFAGGNMTIYSGTGPSKGDFNEATNGKWLCYLNPDGWKAIAEVVDRGEDPSKADIDFEATQVLWTDVTDQPEFNDSIAHKHYYGGW